MEGGHEKLIADFHKKWQTKSPYSLARLVFTAALEELNPTPAKLRPLAALLHGQPESPAGYAETLVLRRLVELASPAPGQAKPPVAGKPALASKAPPWPLEAVRWLLDVTGRGELAASQAATYAWNADLLEQAARKAARGRSAVLPHGYAALGDAEKQLRATVELYRLIQSRADLVQKAQELLEEALVTLPAYLPYLEADPNRAEAWTAAIRSTRKLHDLLQPSEKGSAENWMACRIRPITCENN